jgi:hypothetical protein
VWIMPGIVHRQCLCRVVDANLFLASLSALRSASTSSAKAEVSGSWGIVVILLSFILKTAYPRSDRSNPWHLLQNIENIV